MHHPAVSNTQWKETLWCTHLSFFFLYYFAIYIVHNYFLKTFIISLYQHHAVSLIKNAAYCCFKEGFQVMHTVSDRPHGFTVIKMNAAVLCFSSDAAHLVELHVENLTTPVSLTHWCCLLSYLAFRCVRCKEFQFLSVGDRLGPKLWQKSAADFETYWLVLDFVCKNKHIKYCRLSLFNVN